VLLNNVWAKLSISIAITSLTLSLLGAKVLSEVLRARANYAAKDFERWEKECEASFKSGDAWPFTKGIERLGRLMRELKTWLPIAAGVLFVVAVFWA